MTKQDLIAKIAEDADITKKAASAALDSFLAGVTAAVAAGEKVTLIGFGTFEPKQRAARTARNPQDPKKTIKIAAKVVPGFKAGKAFKDAVAK